MKLLRVCEAGQQRVDDAYALSLVPQVDLLGIVEYTKGGHSTCASTHGGAVNPPWFVCRRSGIARARQEPMKAGRFRSPLGAFPLQWVNGSGFWFFLGHGRTRHGSRGDLVSRGRAAHHRRGCGVALEGGKPLRAQGGQRFITGR